MSLLAVALVRFVLWLIAQAPFFGPVAKNVIYVIMVIVAVVYMVWALVHWPPVLWSGPR